MKKQPFYLILPDIRSCHNVGSMFRTADAFDVDKIFLVGYTACPPKIQIDKVSLGAEKWVPWEHCDDLTTLINDLKKEGVSIVGLEKTNNSVDIQQVDFNFPLALVMGNEVEGINDDIINLCDRVVHIPMHGKKESLNVSIAAGVAMYSINGKKA